MTKTVLKRGAPRDIGEMLFGPMDDSTHFLLSLFNDDETAIQFDNFVLEKLVVNDEPMVTVWRKDE